MPQFTLSWTAEFKRAYKRFIRKHPDLELRVDEVFQQLESDPFEPSLRLHALTGRFKGLQAVSINYAYRIVLCVEIVDREIVLHNIGSHDEVYG